MAAFWDNQSDQFIKNKKIISLIQTQLLRLEPPYQIIAAGGHVGKCTPEPTLLCSAKEHYENDTCLKNRVQEMLWNIGDLKGLAEWGNKHATGLLPFGVIGPYYLNND